MKVKEIKQSASTAVSYAQTYVEKAAHLLRWEYENPGEIVPELKRSMISYQASRLMEKVLVEIEELVPLLKYDDDDGEEDYLGVNAFQFEEVEEKVHKLLESLKERKRPSKERELISNLRMTDGCSPHEAAMRLAEAARREARLEAQLNG